MTTASVFILLLTTAISVSAQEPALSLADYLAQVKGGNENYSAARQMRQGAKQRGDEWKLMTRPQLIASATHVDDFRETGSPFQGDETRTRLYSLGIEQTSPIGLTGKLTYNLQRTEIPALNQEVAPGVRLGEPLFHTAGPALTLSQSLWRNFAGAETKAAQELMSADAKSSEYESEYAQLRILMEAEVAYWQLALARESTVAAKASYDRAVELRKWVAGRRRVELAEQSDLLQAESLALANELKLKQAVDSEKAAARAFNTMRGIDLDDVAEQLALFDVARIMKLDVPQRAAESADVKAAIERVKLARAAAIQGKERNKPALNLVGSLGFTGRDEYRDDAIDEGWTDKNPDYSVGIEFSMPLDVGSSGRARRGYELAAAASERLVNRRRFELERAWKDLNQTFADARARLQIAARMEEAQKKKLDHERVRHRRGRTTTYQVIQFEQEYADAQLRRVQAQGEVLSTYAQLKTFRGNE